MNQNNKNQSIEQRLNKIESKLNQLWLLLIVVIAFLLIGFYNLSELMQPIATIIIWISIIAAPIYLLAFLIDLKVRFAKEDNGKFLKQLEGEQNNSVESSGR